MGRLDAKKIVAYLLANPTVTSIEAGECFHCHEVTIRVVAKKNGVTCDRINLWHLENEK